MTTITELTPSAVGAIATLQLQGPHAWEFVRERFRRSNGEQLPVTMECQRTWFGTLGDEVIVAIKSDNPMTVEIHCHGGRHVVRTLIEQFVSDGCVAEPWQRSSLQLLQSLTLAPTLRTASILLDQYNGTAQRTDRYEQLRSVGEHLVAPWKVVVAGPPNVGKSSLINALAGYQRSVVAPIAGTTRDVVRVNIALDGWPMELSDTAGLRDSAESLEAEGITRTRTTLGNADLILWLLDVTTEAPIWPDFNQNATLIVANKIDQPATWSVADHAIDIALSATTGDGLELLIERIVASLIPVVPEPGEAVPLPEN